MHDEYIGNIKKGMLDCIGNCSGIKIIFGVFILILPLMTNNPAIDAFTMRGVSNG